MGRERARAGRRVFSVPAAAGAGAGTGAGAEAGTGTGAEAGAVVVTVLLLLEEQDHDYVNITSSCDPICNLREISWSGDGPRLVQVYLGKYTLLFSY